MIYINKTFQVNRVNIAWEFQNSSQKSKPPLKWCIQYQKVRGYWSLPLCQFALVLPIIFLSPYETMQKKKFNVFTCKQKENVVAGTGSSCKLDPSTHEHGDSRTSSLSSSQWNLDMNFPGKRSKGGCAWTVDDLTQTKLVE